ncbi:MULTISPECIES: ATP-grasp domain-containing protein [Lysinibacillus]|nr:MULTISPECIES: ATP-grasp domain-containing protein [Lysinibacillus]AHN24187.1 hypothetical protein T479_11540 [Lysinibacillus varians]MED4545694.1 ATP-grasp domain-containing protein [Lysinibacillus sphaericus]GEC84006.1 hypothetical protein LSP03_37490 [Lysinibacillus sphaericus]SUV17332.1 amino acid ligase of ATP-grasp superfamily [Lysinibacillus sphaericus]
MIKFLLMQQPSSTSLIDHHLFEMYKGNLEIVLITGKESKRKVFHNNTKVVHLNNYFAEEAFKEICDVIEKFKPDFIASNSEKDVYRVSCLRSLFNIQGLKSNFGIFFRDKVKMKSLFEMANIPYTPYCHPYSLEEIVDFQNEHKKIVLKPISGAGSVGVEIFENSEEILKYFKNHGNVMDLINGSYILEKFINGNVFHVDVLSYKNNPLLIIPSKYVNPPHEFLQKNIGGVLLQESSMEYKILKEYSEKIYSVLPEEQYITAIHFEVFQDEYGNFYAGEVAARTGGGMIKDNITQKYKINISLASYDLWISPKQLEKQIGEKENNLSYGYFMITSDAYCVEKLNKEEFEIEKLWIADKAINKHATSSVDAKAGMLLKGENEKEVIRKINNIESILKINN